MSDNRFKFQTVVAAMVILLIFGMYFFVSRNSMPCPEKSKKSAEYVYVDMYDIIHADRKCSRLNYKGMKCDRIKISVIDIGNDSQFCSKCVSDKAFDSLMSMAEDRRMIANMKLRELHEFLMFHDFDVPADYDSFEFTLTLTGDEGRHNRKMIYQALKRHDLTESKTFEEFSEVYFSPEESYFESQSYGSEI